MCLSFSLTPSVCLGPFSLSLPSGFFFFFEGGGGELVVVWCVCVCVFNFVMADS